MNEPLCPYIRRAYYSTLRPNFHIKERVLFDYELLYVKEGMVTIQTEDAVYSGRAGDLFILAPGQRHSLQVIAQAPLVQPHIHFDLLYRENREQIPISFKNLDELTEEERTFLHPNILNRFLSPFPTRFHPHMPRLIEVMLFELIQAVSNPVPHNEIRVIGLFYRLWNQVLTELSYSFENNIHSKRDSVEKIKLYIEQNVSRPLTMMELSDLTHFSKNYITTMYLKEYSITPMQYHAMLRVEKAKSLIRNTNLSISEAADMLGFSSVQAFSRTFKSVDGNNPSFYKHMPEG